MRPESTNPGHKVGWPALTALVLVPLLTVVGLVGLVGDDHDDRVNAAVVNLDEAVTVGDQYIPMGRQLAAAIMEREGANISWTLADTKNAKEGLDSGEYSAVVTIPREFSAAATSFSENDADRARQATIDVSVSENAPVTDAALAQEIARIAADSINSTLTESYLDNVFIGFNTVQEQFTTIVDGATQLADGASQLAEGTDQASDGATQLADGFSLLVDGSADLIDGGAQLVDGGAQVTSGGDQLVAGGSQLTSGSGQLTAGGSELVAGGSALSSGAGELTAGIEEFAGQVPALVDGVGQLVDGAEPLLGALPAYTEGTKQVVGGVSQLKAGLDQVIAGLDGGGTTPDLSQVGELGSAAATVRTGVEGIADGLQQADGALQAFASGLAPAPDLVQQLPGQISGAFQCPVEDQATCALLEQTFAAGAAAGVEAGFRAGAGTASAVLNTPDASGASLAGGAELLAEESAPFFDGVAELSEQLPALAAGLPALREGLQQLSDGAGELVTGAQPLADNADSLGSGATQLLEGMRQLDDQLAAMPAGVEQLSDGVSTFASGLTSYTGGVRSYVDGVGQYVDGVATFSDGLTQFNDGVASYAEGVDAYIAGVGQYADGVVSAGGGVQQLADGLVALDSGAEQLADGLETFASELAKGADQVPSYSEDERAALSTVVASPVSESDELIGGNPVSLVSLLLVAALWVTGLASYVVARAVPSDVVSSRSSSIGLWARTLAVPVMVAAGLGALFGVIGSLAVGLGLGQSLGLVVLLAALGASFVLVNHALAAWLGNIGRGVSVLLLVASLALGLTSSVPPWLSAVAAFSPLQNGLELVRAWMSGGSGVIGALGVAVLVAAIAFGLSYLCVAARRQLTADQFRRRIAA